MSYHVQQLAPQDASVLAGKIAGLGTLMRTNPLPVGRYWQDIFGDNRFSFRQWLAANSQTVHADVTQSFDKNAGGPERDFYIFSVLAPTPWDAKTFGFPSVAPATVTSSEDTADRPPPPRTGFDLLDSIFGLDSDSALLRAGSAVSQVAFWGLLVVGGLLTYRAVDALGLLKKKA